MLLAKDSRLTLSAFRYGTSTLPESSVLLGGSKDKPVVIDFVFFLLEAPGRRILVDPGCDTMPGFEMRNFRLPVEVLKGEGVEPASVTDVLITHAHHDHIDAVRHFPQASVFIQKDEYEQGKKYLEASATIILFTDEIEPAPQIRMKQIGGHSKGSCIVLARINGTSCVICGDECYARQCLTRKIPTGSSCCPERSRAFVEEYSRPEYVTFLCHEPIADLRGIRE